MSPEERQKELDRISAIELEKIELAQSSKIKVEIEDLILAEFAMKFGWQAYLDVKADKISMKEMTTLLAASRKLDSWNTYRQAQAVLIGTTSAQSADPNTAFPANSRTLFENAKADES